jgi:hypothetical protein
VNIKTVVFQRDLRIRGLRSTIGATVQKVKFWLTLEPLFLIYIFLYYKSGLEAGYAWLTQEKAERSDMSSLGADMSGQSL